MILPIMRPVSPLGLQAKLNKTIHWEKSHGDVAWYCCKEDGHQEVFFTLAVWLSARSDVVPVLSWRGPIVVVWHGLESAGQQIWAVLTLNKRRCRPPAPFVLKIADTYSSWKGNVCAKSLCMFCMLHS